MRILVASLLLLVIQAATAQSSRNDDYVNGLKAKYGHRITYKTPLAKSKVEGFNLDCRSKDGRYLPLTHVFLAKLASLDSANAWLTIKVDSRDEDVRVYDELVRKDGSVMDSRVVFELNRWGELRSTNGKSEALMNACFGSQGPIWKFQ